MLNKTMVNVDRVTFYNIEHLASNNYFGRNRFSSINGRDMVETEHGNLVAERINGKMVYLVSQKLLELSGLN